ncbi:MAG: thiamine pyrophosphate-dependent dehydrogenase E1 component subunit alpha [Oscillospiraceae bacterium]|nr:thiamine pyrophosphate-dependent dehydrogenase E1 component subunit alpha [Oscillospiraceae bacterium]
MRWSNKEMRWSNKELYHTMLLIRRFEEKVLEAFAYNKLAGSMFHVCIGEEAVSAGVCSVLNQSDYMTSTHRGHGHFIAKGGDINRMMAELYGKAAGYCHGKGGSMHIADIGLGHLGANGIVGGGFAIATGAAYSSKLRKDNKVTVCFFGDGASNEGLFHESLNMAGVWNLPIVFVCENNKYALSTPIKAAIATKTIAERACAYGMKGVFVDGMNVIAVRDAAKEATDRARSMEGPTLIECGTYRYYGHSRGDVATYRTREEEAEWKARCPVKTFGESLVKSGEMSVDEQADMEKEIAGRLEEACRFADESPYPDLETLTQDIFA